MSVWLSDLREIYVPFDTPSAARWAEQPNRSYIISTTRATHRSRLVNQIDSAEACLDGAGTSQINDSPYRVNPAAPKCAHRFRKNGRLIWSAGFDEFRRQNRAESRAALFGTTSSLIRTPPQLTERSVCFR